MAQSVFTKNKLKIFFISLLVFAIVSVGLAIGAYFYFGHAIDANGLTEKFEDKLRLGSSFTVEEVVAQEEYEYAWLSDKWIKVEVYATNKNEESSVTEEILSYDEETRTFTVVGIAKGYIKFMSGIDSTVSFSVPFTTKFSSNDTQGILMNNYSSLYEDEIISSSEIMSVEDIKLRDRTVVDVADFSYFKNLKKIVIDTPSDTPLIDFENLALPNSATIYVASSYYLDYVNRSEENWSPYINRIYPATSDFHNHSIVLNKNGGKFSDDIENQLEFQATEIADGQSINLSSDYAISREGYDFMGWFVSNDGVTMQGEALEDSYQFTADVKLYANWKAHTYTVKAHSNNDNLGEFYTKTFTYDQKDVIADEFPTYTGFKQIGWAYDENETDIVFSTTAEIQNLTAVDGEVIEVYAIWAYESFTIQYYVWDNNKQYKQHEGDVLCDYGENITLSNQVKPHSDFGDFMGWALEPNAEVIDYEYATKVSTVEELYRTSKQSRVVKIYAIYQLTTYSIQYNANGGSPIPSIHADIYRNEPVTLANPITKVGSTFMGWEDNAGYIWTSNELISQNPSFFNASEYKNKVKTCNLSPRGFEAERGIYTVASSQVKLTAKWRTNSFHIKFQSNDATGLFQDAIAYYGGGITFSGDTTKTGYTYTQMNSTSGAFSFEGNKILADKINKIYTFLKNGQNDNDFDETSTITFEPAFTVNYYTLTISSGAGCWLNVTVNGVKMDNGSHSVAYGSEIVASGGYDEDDYEDYEHSGLGTYTMPNKNKTISNSATKKSCLASGTLIQMSDGTQKAIENVSVGDSVLVWDFEQGKYTDSIVAVIEHDATKIYTVVDLLFDDGCTVSLISEHGFFDADLNKFIYITTENVNDYIGHRFIKMSYEGDELTYVASTLLSVNIEERETAAHSMVTAKYISHYANGYLTIAAGIDGLFNIFEVADGMKYDAEQMQLDIEKYGTYSYEDFADYVSYEEYIAFNGAYLKVSVGKGLTTFDEIIDMVYRYLR